MAKENEAINNVIHQLIKYDIIVELNQLDTNHLKIFLSSSLDTAIYPISEPVDFDRYFSVGNSTDAEIKAYKEQYDEYYKNRKKEQKEFAPFKKGKIKKRTLDYKFEYSNLQVKLIEYPDKFEELKQNEYGFLYISRIVFNRHFDKGYLAYAFFCGEGCYWSENIEIVRVNGKWKISETFSGGIA